MYHIFNENSIQYMQNMENESVDLIVTSPPYAAKKEYESWEGLEQYKSFANEWMDAAVPLLKSNGSLLNFNSKTDSVR